MINTGSKLVLVDSGAGDFFGPKSGGRLVANLKASGYRPDQIDAVLLTHIHGDHSGGLTVGGKVIFPNATVYVNEREKDYWLSSVEEAKAPPEKKSTFSHAHAVIDPYIEKGRLKTFAGETELFPGIRTWPHPGHTPGHTFYVVESRGQKLVLMGDTVHAKEVQFPRPEITISFDHDSTAAAAQRKQFFEDACRQGLLGRRGPHLLPGWAISAATARASPGSRRRTGSPTDRAESVGDSGHRSTRPAAPLERQRPPRMRVGAEPIGLEPMAGHRDAHRGVPCSRVPHHSAVGAQAHENGSSTAEFRDAQTLRGHPGTIP